MDLTKLKIDVESPYSMEQIHRNVEYLHEFMRSHPVCPLFNPSFRASCGLHNFPITEEKPRVVYLIYITSFTSITYEDYGTYTKKVPVPDEPNGPQQANLFCGRNGVVAMLDPRFTLNKNGETSYEPIIRNAICNLGAAQRMLEMVRIFFREEPCEIYTYKLNQQAACDFECIGFAKAKKLQ